MMKASVRKFLKCAGKLCITFNVNQVSLKLLLRYIIEYIPLSACCWKVNHFLFPFHIDTTAGLQFIRRRSRDLDVLGAKTWT